MCGGVVKAGLEAGSDGPLLQTPSQRRPREPDDGNQTVRYTRNSMLRLDTKNLFNFSKPFQTLLKVCHAQPASDPSWMLLWMSGISLACLGGFWVISVITTAAEATAPLTSTQTK